MSVVTQYAEGKQAILSSVAAGLGIALVLTSYKDMNADGVKYLAFTPKKYIEGLSPSAIWHQGSNNTCVRSSLEVLSDDVDELTRDL